MYYKIENNYPVISPIPLEGFTEYTVGSEPQELKDAIASVEVSAIKAEIEQAIQDMLDAKARELRYDNIMSVRSYAGYVNPFQVEAQALAVWCAECWKKAGELEASGNVYTVEEVLAQMPVYVP